MTDPVLGPAYLIRLYAWEVLQRNAPETWDKAKYGGQIPIVPVAEEPDLDAYSGPHIVYGYAIDSTGSLYARKSGSLTFAVYDDNFRRLTDTLNILQAAFERQDETARDINRYSSMAKLDGTYSWNSTNPLIGIRFGTVSLGFVEGGTPEDTEGGRQSGLINIRFEYYVDYDVITQIP